MGQTKLRIYIASLASSLLLLSLSQSKACGFYESEADYRAMMFKVSLPSLQCMQPFNYTPSSLYYLPVFNSLVSDPNENDRYRNCQEWKNACGKKPSIDDIYTIQYNTDPIIFIDAYENNTLLSVFKNNSFVEYIVANEKTGLLNYMVFAKKAELCEVGRISQFENWNYTGYNYQDNSSEIGKARAELFATVESRIKEKNSQFLKERYAFQLCRLYYHFNQYSDVIATYDQYFGKMNPNSLMSVWTCLFKAMATPPNTPEYYRLLIQVFNNCDEKKFRCVQLFNKNFNEQELNEQELSTVLVMMALKNPGRALDQIERAYQLDKTNKYIPFLVLREINKLEDWIIIRLFYGEYSITNDDPFRSAYYNISWEEYKKKYPEDFKDEEDKTELQKENLVADMKYVTQLKTLLSTISVGTSSETKDFYTISLAHLSLLEENTADARKYMSMVSDNANPSILLQKKVESLWLAIKTQDIESDKFKEYFVKNIPDLERISMPNFDNDKMLYTLTLSLANEYSKKGNRVYGNLVRLKSDWYVNTKFDWYYSHYRNGDSYTTIEYFDKNATIADMDILISLLEKKKKTAFEEFLTNQFLSSVNAYKDLKGTIAFRNKNFELAYSTFASMPQDYWQGESFSFGQYLNEDPFVPKGLIANKKRSFDYKFNKTDFTKELMTLEEQATKNDNKSSDYYRRLGDAYFNTTYWGNSWMMMRYSWNYDDRNYTQIDKLPTWMGDYMTAETARKYYEKSLNGAITEDQKAYATVMLRYIHYLNFLFRMQNSDKLYAEKYGNNLANYEHTKAYKIYRYNCSLPFIK